MQPAAGAEFERDLGFAGLHQLLGPLLGSVRELSPAYRSALWVALGVRAGSPPGQLMVANAVRALLALAARRGPVLLVVDDLQWLDRASALTLGVVARRLTGTRIGVLAGSCTGEDGFFDRGGLPVHEVLPLSEAAAAELVGDRYPALAPRVRQRLLADAQGNPLALLELPVGLSGLQRSGSDPLPQRLPLSRRLQAVFDSRITALPDPTRHLLLLAALDGTGWMQTLHAAAPGSPGVDDLAPAERAGLVLASEDGSRIEFRHPLTRSAVVAGSTVGQRRRDAALARQLAGSLTARRTSGPGRGGPGRAGRRPLALAAYRIRQRGDAVGAVTALVRAAELTPPGPRRSRRLAEAAYLGAVVTGGLSAVPGLLDDARQADVGTRARWWPRSRRHTTCS